MHPRRLVRINELIHQEISRVTLNLKDPGIGFITITGAKVTADVSLARIYYSVLGGAEEREATALALERAKPFIRSSLAKLENLRKIPDLLFLYDEGVEKADRVSRILNTIHK